MKRKGLKILCILFSIIFVVIIYINNVDKNITKEDVAAIKIVLDSLEIDNSRFDNDYDYQIKTIVEIQKKVLTLIHPSSTGIPFGEKREPAEVVSFHEGQCFDRSRLIEKIFIYYGLRTRHLAIYSNPESISVIKLLLGSDTHSHSTSEVKTLKGWLIVDSNSNWISLSKIGYPLSYKKINANNLNQKPLQILEPFYLSKAVSIYGLYSRHGEFYPPFNKIPDFNYRELLYNLGF